jgi:enamine deaminase RidA (YjgF/YER057c/UK114 family)
LDVQEQDVVFPPGWQRLYDRLHYAPAVRDGDRLWCSGVTGVGSDGQVSADPHAQFTRAFELVGCVRPPYPAWTAIGVAELAVPGALMEIRVVARLR